MGHEHDGNCGCLDRRSLLGLSGVGLATLAGLAGPAGAQALTEDARAELSPQEIVDLILEGNRRFVAGAPQPRDWVEEERLTAGAQHPAAVFLSCIDSRAPVEVICDLGIGQAFNTRVAGNAVNDDVLGSLEFATALSGAKVVMVMGHSSCGAIKGAIDGARLGNLTLLLARFQNAVEETAYSGERTSKNLAFVDEVAKTHVAMSLYQIRERSEVLRELEGEGRIRMVGAFYDLETHQVSLL